MFLGGEKSDHYSQNAGVWRIVETGICFDRWTNAKKRLRYGQSSYGESSFFTRSLKSDGNGKQQRGLKNCAERGSLRNRLAGGKLHILLDDPIPFGELLLLEEPRGTKSNLSLFNS